METLFNRTILVELCTTVDIYLSLLYMSTEACCPDFCQCAIKYIWEMLSSLFFFYHEMLSS